MGVILVQKFTIAFQTDFRGNIAFFEGADDRMDQNSITNFKRDLGQEFMRTVNWISGLESCDGFPSSFFDSSANIFRRSIFGGELIRILALAKGSDLAAYVERFLLQCFGNTGVFFISCAKSSLAFGLFVIAIDIRNGDITQDLTIFRCFQGTDIPG